MESQGEIRKYSGFIVKKVGGGRAVGPDVTPVWSQVERSERWIYRQRPIDEREV